MLGLYVGWLAGCMGFVWVHVESFLHSVASPFHSFVSSLWLSTSWISMRVCWFFHSVVSPFHYCVTSQHRLGTQLA